MPSFVGEYYWLIGALVVTIELVLATGVWRWHAGRPSATRRFTRFGATLLIPVTVIGWIAFGFSILLTQQTSS